MPAKKSKEAVELPEKSFDFFKVLLEILLVAAIVGLGLLYQKFSSVKNELAVLKDPTIQQEKIKAETDELVGKVGKLMVLPEGEPAIATVVDSQKLASEQAFFKDATNGDKVLIYKDKAILYNVQENRIVNVGPILLTGNQEAEATQVLTIEVRNGSQKIGAANELGDELKKEGFNVGAVDNAANPDYKETVLVNLTGKDVKALEEKFKTTAVDKLPDGEATSTQDVVVILGNK